MGQKRTIVQIDLSDGSDELVVRTPKHQLVSKDAADNAGRRWTRSMASKATRSRSKAANLDVEVVSTSTPVLPRQLRFCRPTHISVMRQQETEPETVSELPPDPITIGDDSDSSVEFIRPSRRHFAARESLSHGDTKSPDKIFKSDAEEDMQETIEERDIPTSDTSIEILPQEVLPGKRNMEDKTKERKESQVINSLDGFKQPAMDRNEAKGRWAYRYLSESLDKMWVTGGGKKEVFCEKQALGKDGALLEDAGPLVGKLLFWSKLETDEPLDCLLDKVEVIHIRPEIFRDSEWTPPEQKYYYSMGYNEAFSTFYALSGAREKEKHTQPVEKNEHLILDLFCGCGGLSTGLCMGTRMSNVKLKTQWAVDNNASSCESFRVNHTQTEVYNCSAENFLRLIQKWDELCKRYPHDLKAKTVTRSYADKEDCDESCPRRGEYEVEEIIGIRWSETKNSKLSTAATGRVEFKVKWRGYDGIDDPTWEPEDNLKNSQDILKNFILSGRRKKILPRLGECDLICGGPPCQGVSGMNRFRRTEEPLGCDKNRQVIVYMDIVEFLKPRFILMENVVDILQFADGIVARYALTRLIRMQYQAKLGLMAAGRYGVPQYRQRIFLWGASQNEKNEVNFEDADGPQNLHPCATLGDALTDLPPVILHF
ncbi:hypothetical protein R1flu_000457 [Riccia fluitans]|uniref:DNA (cytosine-5-)-methyltransferase n=1 Tax=Riccia fluitans TaxID=41844 RepID=A0ABD1Y3N7_9MARC